MSSLSERVYGCRGVVFDLFHTLTALEVTTPEGKNTSEMLGVDPQAWERQLMELTPERALKADLDPMETMKRMARAVQPSLSDEVIAKAFENRRSRFEISIVEPPEKTINVLARLKKMGKKIGLCSNAESVEVQAWDRGPMAPFFDCALFSCFEGCAKPDREIYDRVLGKLGLKAGECLFVGDGGSRELEGARAAGFTTVLRSGIVGAFYPGSVEARRVFADFEINALEELVNG